MGQFCLSSDYIHSQTVLSDKDFFYQQRSYRIGKFLELNTSKEFSLPRWLGARYVEWNLSIAWI